MSFDFPFVRLFGVRSFCYYPYLDFSENAKNVQTLSRHSGNAKNIQTLSGNIQTMLRQIRSCSDFIRKRSDI